MRFRIKGGAEKKADEPKAVELIQDGDGVNIKVNGETVAWFDENGKFVTRESWLNDVGISLEAVES